MKRILFCLVFLLSGLTLCAQEIYEFTVTDADGKSVALSNYRGKVLLIVNTATRCGFTPQYKELEALYEQYAEQGLEILDFPCNQFGQQAPGTVAEIRQFCSTNFDVRFPQFDKIDVNGPTAAPLFTYLKEQKGFAGFDLKEKAGQLLDSMLRKQDADYDKKSDIKWNFTKFLISRDGRVLRRYEPTEPISNIEKDVKQQLVSVSKEQKADCGQSCKGKTTRPIARTKK
ncbi:glutathione peroxidase [Alloprevotella tannerae]|uniref:glutathione peroxidase n=1 Tax=Alloprevotella tannerae TaxID=76122 RepID=UPI00288AF40A|nr:glutathione peroxidase [Alloprevotella tannerae]